MGDSSMTAIRYDLRQGIMTDDALRRGGVSEELDNDKIETALRKILESRDFRASPRLAQMLTFIVEETLEGRGPYLKAFYIANQVFGRDENFDAATDPLVRVQANRLRKAIEHYYLTEGANDPVRISVPKGRYCAEFQSSGRAGTSSAVPAAPTIAVLPFATASAEDLDYFADGLAEELTTALARVENFRVVSRHSTRQYGKGGQDIRDIGQELAVRFILEGSVQRSVKAVRVTAQLTDASDGVQVWADSYSRKLQADDLFDIQDEIVAQVIAKVADTYGVIPRMLEKETRGKRTNDLEAYDSLLRFYHYQANLGLEQYDYARRGLLKAIERDPEYGPALAALAELACDNLTLRYHEPYDRLDEAYDYARRAISVDPECQQAHFGMALVQFQRRDRDECIRSARKIIELNANVPYYAGVAGWLIALAGEWEQGLEILEGSIEQNPFYPDWWNLAPFQYYFFKEQYEQALAAAERMILPGLPWDPLVRLASLARLGKTDEASAVLQQLNREFPDFAGYAHEYIHHYVFEEKHADLIYDALLEAGLTRADRE